MKFELDYGFAKPDVQGYELTLLQVIDCSRGAGGTTVVDAKGAAKSAVIFSQKVILDSGRTKIRLVWDSELRAKALADAGKVMPAKVGVEFVVEHTLKGSHASLGQAERYVGRCTSLIRAVLF